MFYIYIPWKRQKTFGFLMFSEGIEMEQWVKMGWELKHCYDVTDKACAAFPHVQMPAQSHQKYKNNDHGYGVLSLVSMLTLIRYLPKILAYLTSFCGVVVLVTYINHVACS